MEVSHTFLFLEKMYCLHFSRVLVDTAVVIDIISMISLRYSVAAESINSSIHMTVSASTSASIKLTEAR